MGRGCVDFFLPAAIRRWTGKQGELGLCNTYSVQEQWEAKVKVKETDPTWSQFFPVIIGRSGWI